MKALKVNRAALILTAVFSAIGPYNPPAKAGCVDAGFGLGAPVFQSILNRQGSGLKSIEVTSATGAKVRLSIDQASFFDSRAGAWKKIARPHEAMIAGVNLGGPTGNTLVLLGHDWGQVQVIDLDEGGKSAEVVATAVLNRVPPTPQSILREERAQRERAVYDLSIRDLEYQRAVEVRVGQENLIQPVAIQSVSSRDKASYVVSYADLEARDPNRLERSSIRQLLITPYRQRSSGLFQTNTSTQSIDLRRSGAKGYIIGILALEAQSDLKKAQPVIALTSEGDLVRVSPGASSDSFAEVRLIGLIGSIKPELLRTNRVNLSIAAGTTGNPTAIRIQIGSMVITHSI